MMLTSKADNIFILSPTSPTPIASHQQSIQTNQMAFCWSGKKIFLPTGDGKVKILSYPSFEPILRRKFEDVPFTLSSHTSSCIATAVSPSGRYLSTGGTDSIIALWDTSTWICSRTLIDMTGPVRSISFSFDGSYVVGGSDEGSGLEISHVETGEQVHSIKTTGPCPIVEWHPSRYWLAYTDFAGLKIVGVESARGG
jgi:THO complex subunit 3